MWRASVCHPTSTGERFAYVKRHNAPNNTRDRSPTSRSSSAANGRYVQFGRASAPTIPAAGAEQARAKSGQVIGPAIGGEHRAMVAEPATHGERPHALGAHVGERHRGRRGGRSRHQRAALRRGLICRRTDRAGGFFGIKRMVEANSADRGGRRGGHRHAYYRHASRVSAKGRVGHACCLSTANPFCNRTANRLICKY